MVLVLVQVLVQVLVPEQYLKQDLNLEDGKTILEDAQSAFTELIELEKKLNDLNKQLNERTDYENKEYLELINQFNETEERFRFLGGNDIHSEISQVLSGLGFSQYDFSRQSSEFSGGFSTKSSKHLQSGRSQRSFCASLYAASRS